MRNALVVVAAMLVAGCASQRNNANGRVPAPEVAVAQTSNLPTAAEQVAGGVSVSVRLSVTNNATIPITLQSAEFSTFSEGGWNLPRAQRHGFGKAIAPGATESFDVWLAAVAGLSIVGANGPVSLRVTTTFDSTEGGFNNVVMQQVGGTFH